MTARQGQAEIAGQGSGRISLLTRGLEGDCEDSPAGSLRGCSSEAGISGLGAQDKAAFHPKRLFIRTLLHTVFCSTYDETQSSKRKEEQLFAIMITEGIFTRVINTKKSILL